MAALLSNPLLICESLAERSSSPLEGMFSDRGPSLLREA
jgi:hypothetical protein